MDESDEYALSWQRDRLDSALRVVDEYGLADLLAGSVAQVEWYKLLGLAGVRVLTTLGQVCIGDITRRSQAN